MLKFRIIIKDRVTTDHNNKMISLRKIASFGKIIKLQQKQVALFSDSWKERDEAAEKVYITRAESKLYSIT